MTKTSISTGIIIGKLLAEDPEVAAIVTKVFPVMAAEKAILPYCVFRAVDFDQTLQKKRPGADSVIIEVACCATSYAQSVALAEAVRATLDFATASIDGLAMRSCTMTGREEMMADDAWIQNLVFDVRV